LGIYSLSKGVFPDYSWCKDLLFAVALKYYANWIVIICHNHQNTTPNWSGYPP
jgi:hypothetical protein